MISADDEKEILFITLQSDKESDAITKLAFHPKGNFVLHIALDILKEEQFCFIVDQLMSQI